MNSETGLSRSDRDLAIGKAELDLLRRAPGLNIHKSAMHGDTILFFDGSRRVIAKYTFNVTRARIAVCFVGR